MLIYEQIFIRGDYVEEICMQTEMHTNTVENAKKNMPEENLLYRLAQIFDVFGDTTRIKIISVLSLGEMCVCDIAETLSMTHSAVSHQLRILRQSDVVTARKDGKTVFYSLADNHISKIYHMGLTHIMHGKEV